MGSLCSPVIVGLPKGRFFEPTLDLVRQVGVQLPFDFSKRRRLIVDSLCSRWKVALVKEGDIPMLLRSQVIDLGFVGEDYLLEHEIGALESWSLNMAVSSLCVYGRPEMEFSTIKRVASLENVELT